MYQNEFDVTGKCAKEGLSAEDSFFKILNKRGSVQRASLAEQKKHIDFILTIGDKTIKYDVKARKRVKRKDDCIDDELIWVEWLNVYGGNGWINGKCDFIAFEQENSFIIIAREKLKALCEKLCDMTSLPVKSSSQALYKCYQRFGRKDLISLIKTSDVLTVADEVVSKIETDKA